MAAVELIRGTASEPEGGSPSPWGVLRAEPARSSRQPLTLLGGLLALVLYAAFAHGATALAAQTRVEIALAALAALAGAGMLWSRTLRASAPVTALAGLGLLLAFAIWAGVTVLWSISPDQTWLELNRAISYALALALAIVAGASHPRSVELAAKGLLAVALAVTVYALGQKLAPGLHVHGLFSLDQGIFSARLRAPLDYWNALALFIAFGVPVALALALERSRSVRSRIGVLLVAELMLVAIGLTYSRGGVLALVLALAAWIGLLGEGRLRAIALLALVCVASAAPVVFGLSNHDLTAAGVPLAHREAAGGLLAAVLLASVAALLVAGRLLIRSEGRRDLGPRRSRQVGWALGALVGLALGAGLLALALSPRGLDGSISHAVKGFTTRSGAGVYDPSRIVSADSGNRWLWWREAAGAFSDRPVEGWGAGSFPRLHLLYRRDALAVLQPHSVPLQFLAEGGLVGGLLGIGAYVLLLAAGVGAVRRRAPERGRVLAGALLAVAVAYAIHALYDFDWNIPGVTLPPLLALGVLAGARGGRARERLGPPGPGPGVRVLALGGLTFVLALVALAALLPDLASRNARSALVAASSGSAGRQRGAIRSAALATRLDPLSDEGSKAAATIALHRGLLTSARDLLLEAIRRAPDDVQAWTQLASVEQALGNSRGLLQAANRALALDPRGPMTQFLVIEAYQSAVPPNQSATATGTPLPAAG